MIERTPVPVVRLSRKQHAKLVELVAWYDGRPKHVRYEDSFGLWYDQQLHGILNGGHPTFNQWMLQAVHVVSGKIQVTLEWEEYDEQLKYWTTDPVVVTVEIV